MGKRNLDVATSPLSATAAELRVLLGQLRRRLREQASQGDLTASQISVLGRIERDGPTTVTALAQIEGVRPQSMGATVATLQAAGFIAGTPHPTDGRQTLLSLTPACHAWIKKHRAQREDWLVHTMQAKLSLAEQKKVADAIGLLKRLVEP
ncbi:MarR family winged helix-turn-helix transcriptional regulator [Dyella dinghuensis]|nr:MarR family transcriptional regulator [Dyella dinghuensis]